MEYEIGMTDKLQNKTIIRHSNPTMLNQCVT